ncbi:hypothetical protein H1Q63_34310 [Desmonostoc muscorum CCALA 125]|nr:hypothetical protein [Desmonostoc muscorum CCALA 125]
MVDSGRSKLEEYFPEMEREVEAKEKPKISFIFKIIKQESEYRMGYAPLR